jgi:hypothetical protein
VNNWKNRKTDMVINITSFDNETVPGFIYNTKAEPSNMKSCTPKVSKLDSKSQSQDMDDHGRLISNSHPHLNNHFHKSTSQNSLSKNDGGNSASNVPHQTNVVSFEANDEIDEAGPMENTNVNSYLATETTVPTNHPGPASMTERKHHNNHNSNNNRDHLHRHNNNNNKHQNYNQQNQHHQQHHNNNNKHNQSAFDSYREALEGSNYLTTNSGALQYALAATQVPNLNSTNQFINGYSHAKPLVNSPKHPRSNKIPQSPKSSSSNHSYHYNNNNNINGLSSSAAGYPVPNQLPNQFPNTHHQQQQSGQQHHPKNSNKHNNRNYGSNNHNSIHHHPHRGERRPSMGNYSSSSETSDLSNPVAGVVPLVVPNNSRMNSIEELDDNLPPLKFGSLPPQAPMPFPTSPSQAAPLFMVGQTINHQPAFPVLYNPTVAGMPPVPAPVLPMVNYHTGHNNNPLQLQQQLHSSTTVKNHLPPSTPDRATPKRSRNELDGSQL